MSAQPAYSGSIRRTRLQSSARAYRQADRYTVSLVRSPSVSSRSSFGLVQGTAAPVFGSAAPARMAVPTRVAAPVRVAAPARMAAPARVPVPTRTPRRSRTSRDPYTRRTSPYTRTATAQREFAPARESIRVIPGTRRAVQEAPSSSILSVAKVVATVLLVVACMGVARVAFTTETVVTDMQSQELSTSIDEARSSGVSLEATQSVLSSSSRIKTEATALGMAAPSEVETLTLSADVVVQNDDGTLSLSKSLAAVANAGA